MDQEPHHYQRHLPIRRIIFWTGIALILVGYVFLSAPSDTFAVAASARAFIGLGMVICGAFLWLGAIFFNK